MDSHISVIDFICLKGGPVIHETTVQNLKESFFAQKISNLIVFHVLVVTKQQHLRTNLVTKPRHMEQILSPNGVTRHKPSHQN